MNNENNRDAFHPENRQFDYPVIYRKEEEIDLYALVSAIFSQWRLLCTITFAGILLSIILALALCRQYEVDAQIALPTSSNVRKLNAHGVESFTAEQVFTEFYNQVRSAEQLKIYLEKGSWYQALFPESFETEPKDRLFSIVYQQFKVNVLRPKKNKGDESLHPELIGLEMTGENEQVLVKLINEYLTFSNQYLLDEMTREGKQIVSLELEKFRRAITEARADAKRRRELLIAKLEEQNKEKIAALEQEKTLLIEKALRDKEARMAMLTEAYEIADKVGIKKLTTIDSLATEDKNARTIVSLGGGNNKIYALMGTAYLKSELETLKNRKDISLFIPRLSEITKQIELLKHDKTLLALKQRKSDDPYIDKLPGFFRQIEQLKQISFDFTHVRLYRLDKAAHADGVAEKPNRKLIVVVGAVLSGFVALFVVLIVGSIKNHRENEGVSKDA